ncbi:MAG: tryptophan synthase subunit alpha [Pseudomonadota bacterium]
MSRYAAMFDRLAATSEGAFGAFLMLGDPDLDTSLGLLDAVMAAGADMIEVGIPFSDPVADGPVIQAAGQRALASGVRTADCFALIAKARQRHREVPIGILTYANLVVARGPERFFAEASAAGADSLLVADLPAFEAEPWAKAMRNTGIAPVLIAASNTPPETLRRVARLSSGYTYCVTRSGITGTHGEASFDSALIGALKEAGAPPPVFGFGISNPGHVRAALAAGAAGVICGSAIVECAARGGDIGAFVRELKQATGNDFARR